MTNAVVTTLLNQAGGLARGVAATGAAGVDGATALVVAIASEIWGGAVRAG